MCRGSIRLSRPVSPDTRRYCNYKLLRKYEIDLYWAVLADTAVVRVRIRVIEKENEGAAGRRFSRRTFL